MKLGLEIGPGNSPINLPGYTWRTMGVNGMLTDHAEWGAAYIPLPNNSYHFIYASHVIEHVPYYKVKFALKDALRVLAPGGKIELWTPDFSKIVDAWRQNSCGDSWRRFNPKGDPWMWRNGRLFAYEEGADASNWHRSSYCPDELSALLLEAGFSNVKLIPKRLYGVGHGACEFGLTGEK